MKNIQSYNQFESNGYIPGYEKGTLWICFKKNVSEDFVKDFCELKGLEYVGREKNYMNNVFIIKAEFGKERELMDSIKDHEFIEWVERKDIVLLNKWEKLDEITHDLGILTDNASEFSPEKWNIEIDSIIDRLKKSKY